MEMENTKMNGMREFADEFFRFGSEFTAKNGDLKLSGGELVTLFAVFKKNMRVERMNGNGCNSYSSKPKQDQSATDRQVNAIRVLMRKGKINADPKVEINNLSKMEASRMISEALGR